MKKIIGIFSLGILIISSCKKDDNNSVVPNNQGSNTKSNYICTCVLNDDSKGIKNDTMYYNLNDLTYEQAQFACSTKIIYPILVTYTELTNLGPVIRNGYRSKDCWLN